MNIGKYLIALSAGVFAIAGCSSRTNTAKTDDTAAADSTEITFNADSAYSFVARQCEFGERVPNTAAHTACGDWLTQKLSAYGAKVTEQCTDLKAFDGTVLHSRNIIGEFYPEKQKRVLLVAHWDCRPWADADPDEANRTKPVMGANDGASGAGLLIEMARMLQAHEPETGVDILLVDAEDWGNSDANDESSWALGAHYWANHPHRDGYTKPEYAILVDMVGDANAQFYMEYFSQQFAPDLVARVWNIANSLGYGRYFIKEQGGAITDDHLQINSAGIPCIDIIDMRTDSETGFCSQWHTIDDTMDHISPNTLKAVGQTLATLIWK